MTCLHVKSNAQYLHFSLFKWTMFMEIGILIKIVGMQENVWTCP